MVIFKHNFRRFLTLKFLIIYFIIFIPVLWLFIYAFDQSNFKYEMVTSYTLIDRKLASFFVLTFFWTLGIPFLITTASRGSALIQQEIDEETLVLLVSKPIDRKRIYLEKWLASFAISLLIGILSLFISLTMYIFIFKIDSIILFKFLEIVPGLIIYILFINFTFTSISMVITSLLKHRVRAVIILVVVIMTIFVPIIKNIMSIEIYTKYKIFLFDFNYQYGVMYYYIIKTFSSFNLTPLAQEYVNIMITIFRINNISDINYNFLIVARKVVFDYLKPVTMFLFWLILSGFNMYISYYLFMKKDIS